MCEKNSNIVLNEKDDIRKQYINISENQFVYCLAGQLYAQSPNSYPRKVEIIMKKAIEAFRCHDNHSVMFGDSHYVAIPINKTYEFCDKLLKAIPEFIELNLTQIEFEKQISVDDPNRPKFGFTSAYDVRDEKSWKHDFVDLDAFIQNFHRNLVNKNDVDNDCFLCKHQDPKNESTLAPGNDEKCKTCKINPTFIVNYECKREARGDYTIACNYDCYRSYYICCSECDIKETCTHKCKGTPETCNNHK